MVKEYDEGEEGAAWIAVVPTSEGQLPSCTRGTASGEWRTEPGCEYFKGATGKLIFTVDCDGDSGGLWFTVYDSTTQKKIFRDSAALASKPWGKRVENSPWDPFEIGKAGDGQPYLRYRRVVTADCDLDLEKNSCWDQTKVRLDLKEAPLPLCSGYKGGSEHENSVVAYPVEVLLLPRPTMKTFPGQIKCWPVD